MSFKITVARRRRLGVSDKLQERRWEEGEGHERRNSLRDDRRGTLSKNGEKDELRLDVNVLLCARMYVQLLRNIRRTCRWHTYVDIALNMDGVVTVFVIYFFRRIALSYLKPTSRRRSHKSGERFNRKIGMWKSLFSRSIELIVRG